MHNKMGIDAVCGCRCIKKDEPNRSECIDEGGALSSGRQPRPPNRQL